MRQRQTEMSNIQEKHVAHLPKYFFKENPCSDIESEIKRIVVNQLLKSRNRKVSENTRKNINTLHVKDELEIKKIPIRA